MGQGMNAAAKGSRRGQIQEAGVRGSGRSLARRRGICLGQDRVRGQGRGQVKDRSHGHRAGAGGREWVPRQKAGAGARLLVTKTGGRERGQGPGGFTIVPY